MRHFKSSSTEAEDALDDLHLDGDGTSDEYDFMDDADDGDAARTRARRQKSKAKYMNMLQDVADRTTSQVTVDLDDLKEVCARVIVHHKLRLTMYSMKRA